MPKKINLKHLLLLSLFFAQIALFGQADRTRNVSSLSGEIFGRIIDSTTNQSLEFAAVTLYKSGTEKIVTGNITNDLGKFSLTEVPLGRYDLAIQFVGYPIKTISNLVLSESVLALNLKDIYMVSNNLLNEVVVDGSTPIIQYDIDKKVIDVSNLEVDLGQSAVEILQNSPSIIVENDGTVLLRGSSSFTLFIDGRPTAMDASTALATIPASTIKNIEIITNPSAKYEAEGVSGIINIVTKTTKLEGVSLLANVTGGNYDNYSGDVSVNVRKKTTEFNVGIDYRNRSRPQDNFTERTTTFDTSTTMVRSTGLSDWGGANYGANGEFTWTPNNAHTFTVGGRFNRRQRKSITDQFFEEFADDIDVYSYQNLGNSVYDITSSSTFLTYHLNIGRVKTHYLEFRGVYNHRTSDDVQDIEYFDESGTKTGGRKNTEIGPSNMLRFNLDYSNAFKNGMTFEAGSQVQVGKSADENINYEYNPSTGDYELQPLFSSNAEYIRNITGVYSLIKGEKNKFGYQLGLRAEYTDRTINSPQFTESALINRLDWFPTVHLSYKLPNDNQFLINYTRRIERPRSYYLEPFISWRNAYSIYTGNPNLSPEYVDAFELNWIKTFANKGFVSVETYVRLVDNFISRIQVPADTNLTLTTPINVGKTYSIGVEPSVSYKVFDWWRVDLGLNLFNYNIESDHEQIASSSNFNWNSRLTNTFPIKNGWNVQIASRYIGAANTVQGRQEGYFTMNGSVRKSFSQNRYAVIFQMRDIFSTIKDESYETAGNVETYSLSEPRTPTFTITFSLRLNNYEKKREMQEADDF